MEMTLQFNSTGEKKKKAKGPCRPEVCHVVFSKAETLS